jgi:hypothetical protein
MRPTNTSAHISAGTFRPLKNGIFRSLRLSACPACPMKCNAYFIGVKSFLDLTGVRVQKRYGSKIKFKLNPEYRLMDQVRECYDITRN